MLVHSAYSSACPGTGFNHQVIKHDAPIKDPEKGETILIIRINHDDALRSIHLYIIDANVANLIGVDQFSESHALIRDALRGGIVLRRRPRDEITDSEIFHVAREYPQHCNQ